MDEQYAKQLLEKVRDLEHGLQYYINRTRELEIECRVYKQMYEHRVEEYLKLLNKKGEDICL